MPIISLPKNTTSKSITTTNTSIKFNSTVIWLFVGFYVALAVFGIVTFWRVFKKAGRKGWLAIIPIYNYWVIYEIGGCPGWWALLLIVPIANIVALFRFAQACMKIAKDFGKSEAFGILGLFIFFVGWPILAFGKATYTKVSSNPN